MTAEPHSPLLLAIEDLSVAFGSVKAIQDVTMYMDKGELLVIIGPNGAGKTTLLDLICGKTKATAGSIKLKDIELTNQAEHRIVAHGVGRKFQTPSVYEALTVYENLEVSFPQGKTVFGSLLFKMSAEADRKIRETASSIFLDAELDRPAAELSHGQKQWLEIGMLLIQEPELMMLDEPVAGMSVREREQTADLLNRISEGRSIIVIEHDMEFVRRIARKVTVMHQGRILAQGTMDQVQSDPRVIEVYLGH